MIEVRSVKYSGILAASNWPDLEREYAIECSIPDIGPVDPQPEIYERMEATGLMQTFGAFEGERLVGFATVLGYMNPHYGKKIATVESLFLTRAERAGNGGRLLMGALEDHAQRMGCAAVLYSARAGSRLESLLTHLPLYQFTNTVFLRSL